MKASEALLCVLSKLTFLSLGRGRVEFAVTMCCGKKNVFAEQSKAGLPSFI